MLLEAFYEQHKDQLTAVLSRYSGDREASADAVQESFLKALNNRAALSEMPEKQLWSWLYSTAKNALIDEKRKGKRTDLNEIDDAAIAFDDPTDAILARQLLYKLPANLMQVVSLKYFGGLSSSEIGAMKGIPPATVRSQLRSAMTMMKKLATQNR